MYSLIIAKIKDYLISKINTTYYGQEHKQELLADIDSAIYDLRFLKDVPTLYSNNKAKINEILKLSITYANMVDIPSNNDIFMKQIISLIFLEGLSTLTYDMDILKLLMDWMNKHDDMTLLIYYATRETYNPMLALIDNRHITQDMLNQLSNMPIVAITDKPNDLCLYHGTTLANYEKILKDGCIKRSSYKDVEHIGQDSKAKSAYYQHEDGYVFLDAGLDIPIAYAYGNYRDNIIYHNTTLESYLNGTGVIFAVNPTRYNLYLLPQSGEYLIDDDVSLSDTRTYFLKRENGIIKIYDDKGVETNDLCYE